MFIGLTSEQFEEKIQSALSLDLPYSDPVQRRLMDPSGSQTRPAAVCILFASSSQKPSGPILLLTKRSETLEIHKGQMAFPGGLCESQDQGNPVRTALRETEEEMGIPSECIKVLGELPRLVTGTGFLIQPIVGVSKKSLEKMVLNPNPDEIDEVIWVSLQTLLRPETYRNEFFLRELVQYPIDVFQVGQYRIWGATGTILKNLLDRLTTFR